MRDRDLLAALLLLALPLALLSACSPSEPADEPSPRPPAASPAPQAATPDPPPAATPPAPPSQEELAASGRRVYMSNCTACHNMDPGQDGSLGPAVSGSSRELIEARVLQNAYPDGYTPKRTTSLMVALPHLANDIDELTAYLSQ